MRASKKTSYPPPRPLNLILRLPVVDYGIRCLVGERYNELALLGTNLAMILLVGTLSLGYPFLITAMLVIAATAALLILSATVG